MTHAAGNTFGCVQARVQITDEMVREGARIIRSWYSDEIHEDAEIISKEILSLLNKELGTALL